MHVDFVAEDEEGDVGELVGCEEGVEFFLSLWGGGGASERNELG